MKKSSILALFALVFTLAANAATINIKPSKQTETRTINLSAFDELKSSSIVRITYEQSKDTEYQVILTAPKNIIQYVYVVSSRGKLKVGIDNSLCIQGDPNISIKVKAPALCDIELNGASTFKAGNINIPGRKFDIELNGASTADIGSINAAKTEIEAKGASELKIGKLKSVRIEAEASSASNIEISGVNATTTSIEATGASTIKASGITDQVAIVASAASTVKAGSLKSRLGSVAAAGSSTIKAKIETVTSNRSGGASVISISK